MNIDFKNLNKAIDADTLLSMISNVGDRTQQGKNIRIRCTIHGSDNQPSLSIDTENNIFNCFSCGAKGDLIQLFAESTDISIADAAKELTTHFMSENNSIIPAIKTTHSINKQKTSNNKNYNDDDVFKCWNNAKENGRDTYFSDKKLPPPPIARFGKNPFGYYSTLVSLININGDLRGFISLSSKDKFIYKISGDDGIFSLLGEIKDGEQFFIGEGIATVQTAWEAFDKKIPALSVGTRSNFIKVAKEIKKKYPSARPIVLLDLYDEKAKAETQKIKEQFTETVIIHPNFDGLIYDSEKKPNDFNDLISKCGLTMEETKNQMIVHQFEQTDKQIQPAKKITTDSPTHIKEILSQNNLINSIYHRVKEYKENGKISLSGVSTGYSGLDDIIDGFQKEQLIILAARTGMGKSWMALNFMKNIAIDKQLPVSIFSLEMSINQIMYRLISLCSEIPVKKIRKGELSDDELTRVTKAYEIIRQSPIYITDCPTNSKLLNLQKNIHKAAQNPSLVIIDHIGLIKAYGNQSNNRVSEVGEITRTLKLEAKKLSIPIMCISQLNRNADKDEHPKLSDLREGGSIEQDSDVVIFVHRSDYFDSSNRPQELDVIIAKNRDGEQNKLLHFKYNKETWIISEAPDKSKNNSEKSCKQKISLKKNKNKEIEDIINKVLQ